jgi:Flp pilus assembly protein TadG
MRNLKGESGQVLVLTALSMMLMLGFMGFATDVAQLFHAKRSFQAAVDDAAVAGALAYKFDNQAGKSAASDIKRAATTALTLNGLSGVTVTTSYSSSVTSSTLAVMSPPADGPNDGSAGFVETILTMPQSTTFMSLFGFNTVNVTTRAVAGPSGSNSMGCIYILNPTGSEQMYMGGKFTVNAPGCGITVNSSDSCALFFNGGGGGKSSSLDAGWIEVAGGACNQVSDSDPPPVTGSGVQIADPLANSVTQITAADCNGTDNTNSISGSTYTPPSGASIVCFPHQVTISGPGNAGSCNFNGGGTFLNLPTLVYVFEQGVNFDGGCIGSTGGLTLDLTGYSKIQGQDDSINVATNTQFPLQGPDAATGCASGCNTNNYGNENIVIEQPSANSTGIININQGNAIGSITGIIYAPTAELSLQDNGSSSSTGIALTLNADLIVGSFNDQASSVTVNSYQSSSTTSQLTTVTLVE